MSACILILLLKHISKNEYQMVTNRYHTHLFFDMPAYKNIVYYKNEH